MEIFRFLSSSYSIPYMYNTIKCVINTIKCVKVLLDFYSIVIHYTFQAELGGLVHLQYNKAKFIYSN